MASFLSNILVSGFHSAREYLTPVLSTSALYEKGQITPEEFVLAGDYLTRMAPHWSWGRGDASRAKPYLPPDRQFLVLRDVPCRQRAAAAAQGGGGDGDGDVIALGASDPVYPGLPASPAAAGHEEEEYGDLASFMEPELGTVDITTPPQAPVIIAENMRLYEITIVYDNYYRTPRVFLRGFTAAEGRPLGPSETMEDIMQDYAQKTATIEAHPHNSGIQCISIHPCRHAETMRRILEVMIANNDGRRPPVQMFMFLFLKFIGSMIPTIEHDNTMPVDVSGGGSGKN
jgi:ubiquitin-like-conjugating enzyme ATG3